MGVQENEKRPAQGGPFVKTLDSKLTCYKVVTFSPGHTLHRVQTEPKNVQPLQRER